MCNIGYDLRERLQRMGKDDQKAERKQQSKKKNVFFKFADGLFTFTISNSLPVSIT